MMSRAFPRGKVDLGRRIAALPEDGSVPAPPAPMTADWQAARSSVRRLAQLSSTTLAAGHGLPMAGSTLPDAFLRFARHFEKPARGRYVRGPARSDAHGILSLPPTPPDPMGAVLRGAAAGAALAAVALAIRRSMQSVARRRRPTGSQARAD